MPRKSTKGASSSTRRPSRPPKKTKAHTRLQPSAVIPGEVFLASDDIVAFEGRSTIEVSVTNAGDRPIQVGSHCHFFEVNRALGFDRAPAFGYRLCVPAGTAVRFEPGEDKRVTLVAIGGSRHAYGINGLTNGQLDDPDVRRQALARAEEHGFLQRATPRGVS